MTEHYGGTLDELHPEHSDVILAAMDRYSTPQETAADRVLLWFDVVYAAGLAQLDQLEGEWALWDGEYEKEPYMLRVDGESVLCWPNAGKMVAGDGSGRDWLPVDKVEVRQISVAAAMRIATRFRD